MSVNRNAASVLNAVSPYTSDDADIGNPGEYVPIPAPGAVAFGVLGLGLASRRKRA